MGKKGKDDAPTANGVANRDIIQRLNFLYQASVYLNTLPSPSPHRSMSLNPSANTRPSTPKDVKTARKRRSKSLRHVTTASELSRSYIATMKSVGQKTMVKIDPGVKRTLCKGCDLTLIPGETATVRVKKSPSHGHTMVYTCTGCNTSRKIPAPPTLGADSVAANNELLQPVSVLAVSGASGTEATSLPADGTQMGIDPARDNTGMNIKQGTRQKKEKAQARIPPLFAREVGHVVFCGNERLLGNELGDGVYIT